MVHENKFIQVISVFTDEERRHFRRFINTDFVNKNRDVISFCEYILSRRKLTPRTVEKEKIYNHLYPGKPFNDLRIRHLIWMSGVLTERFIALRQLEKNQKLQLELCMDYYIQKELFQYAETCTQELLQLASSDKQKDTQYYLGLHRIYTSHYFIQSKNTRNPDYKVQEIVDNLSIFTLAEMLKNACIAISMKNILETGIEQIVLEWVLPQIKDSVFWQYPLIRIYHQLYFLLSENREELFDSLESEIKMHNNSFPKPELREVYLLLINFCVRRSNQNMLEYTRKAFDLYIYALERKYLYEQQEISRFSFTNVVTLGLKLKEFARTEFFIQQFSPHINVIYRKNTIDYNQAKLLYAKEKLSAALAILLSNEFKDTLWNLNAKFSVLRILFELKDIKTLRSQLQLFKVYISRKKNIGYHRDYFTKVVDAFRILLEFQKNSSAITDFTFDKNTPEMNWFNEQVRNIQKQKTFSMSHSIK